MTELLKGIAASNGIAIGKAFLMLEPDLTISKTTVENIEAEITRFHEAVNAAKQELQNIRAQAEIDLGPENAAIFDAHLLVLSDPELIGAVEGKINDDAVNAEAALQETADLFIMMFEQLDNEYMRERVADIRDVTKRVIAHLLSIEIPNLGLINEEVIIISEDLSPSDTAQLNRAFAKGFTTNMGGRTSHSAIMARSLEIPAVVGTKNATTVIKQGDLVIVDGDEGEIMINPAPDVIDSYKAKRNAQQAEKKELLLLRNKKTMTLDGIHVEVAANIGTPKDVVSVLENGAEGIGLYRTEFLYMERDALPTEEEQFQAYKQVLEQMGEKPVVVRTLDIGGDKQLPYLNLPDEMNPFLGFRAIRFCLEEQTIFKTQLRALLRASTFGNLKIMFPMIATLEEYRAAK